MLEKIPFEELSRFKEETASSEVALYNATKARVRRYRIIFLSIGALFLLLAWSIDHKSALWITGFIKPAVEFFAFMLGVAAFTIAAFLRYETESVRALYHHSVQRLRQKYRLKKAALSKSHEMALPEMFRLRMALRGEYIQAREKLKKLEVETLHVMERITRAREMPLEEKERLYNLALLQMKESFIPVLKGYEQFTAHGDDEKTPS
jgi:hypothetical protein